MILINNLIVHYLIGGLVFNKVHVGNEARAKAIEISKVVENDDENPQISVKSTKIFRLLTHFFWVRHVFWNDVESFSADEE